MACRCLWIFHLHEINPYLKFSFKCLVRDHLYFPTLFTLTTEEIKFDSLGLLMPKTVMHGVIFFRRRWEENIQMYLREGGWLVGGGGRRLD
jgi:hypothetical protein